MNLSIRVKLAAGFTIIVIAVLAIVWQAITTSRTLRDDFAKAHFENFLPTRTIANANIALIAWNRVTIDHILAESVEKMAEYEKIMAERRIAVLRHFDELTEHHLSTRETQLLLDVRRIFDQTKQILDRIVALSRAGQEEAAILVVRLELRPLVDEINRGMRNLLLMQEEEDVDEAMVVSESIYDESVIKITLWLLGLAIGTASLVAFVTLQPLLRNVAALVQAVKLAAGGDLRESKSFLGSHIKRQRLSDGTVDEVGYLVVAFSQMMDALEWSFSEQQSAQEELRKQLAINKTITDNTPSCLFMTDKEGYATFMNPAAEKVTGYTLEEIRDVLLHDAIHNRYPDGRPYPASECPLGRARADLIRTVDHEDTFVRKDGSLFPVICHIDPFGQTGAERGFVLEFRDITERKQAEKEQRAAEQRYRRLVLSCVSQNTYI